MLWSCAIQTFPDLTLFRFVEARGSVVTVVAVVTVVPGRLALASGVGVVASSLGTGAVFRSWMGLGCLEALPSFPSPALAFRAREGRRCCVKALPLVSSSSGS